jgi:hypothetical protein
VAQSCEKSNLVDPAAPMVDEPKGMRPPSFDGGPAGRDGGERGERSPPLSPQRP